MLNCHRERFRKLTFRALALRQSEELFALTKFFLMETSEFCNFFFEFFKFF